MAISAIVDDINEVEEKYRDLYTKKGDKWEVTEVTGARTQADVDRINSALAKERNDHKKAKEIVAKFEGLDPDDVRSKLDRFPELEELAKGKVDENKINELVETRIKSRIAPVEREKKTLEEKAKVLEAQVHELSTRERTGKIESAIRSAAAKAKLLPEAIEDAILLGNQALEVDDNGSVVVKAGTRFSEGAMADVWLTEVQSLRPHWWGQSSGGGSRGSSGNHQTSNPWSAENWNMTEQGRILKQDRVKAEQLAKSAGTKIGGPRPVKK